MSSRVRTCPRRRCWVCYTSRDSKWVAWTGCLDFPPNVVCVSHPSKSQVSATELERYCGTAFLTQDCNIPYRAVQPHQQQMFGEELPESQDGEQPGPARRKRQPSMSETMPLYTLCKEDLESMDKEVRTCCRPQSPEAAVHKHIPDPGSWASFHAG